MRDPYLDRLLNSMSHYYDDGREEEKMPLKDKSPAILAAMQALAKHDIHGETCAWCGSKDIKYGDFKDDLSRKEFRISKMCQKCQDETFVEED